jgi:16S rRNA (guanine966-N2)-methyltransferase
MILRLSGGSLCGRCIRVPRGFAVRPTAGRVKEALFSILGDRIVGARVLDLFAGAGAVGFEALSRGAAHATLVELHAVAAAALRATAEEFGLTESVRVVRADARRVAARLIGRFDFVYADPPYALPPPIALFTALRASGVIDARTIMVYEHRSSAPTVKFPGLVTEREARYGEVMLQFLRSDVTISEP